MSFTISFLLRSQPIEHGFELNEFDPFFNYRATQYIVDNGIDAYFNWNDDLSWYPHGRNISASSQILLHLTAASTYSIFGGNSSLYDFTIMFPVIFGSLTSIAIFALVRVIGGTTAGLISAMLFSVSLPILIRSPIGWFKSEPLGLFFSILAVYLLLSGLNSKNKKVAFSKLLSAGILTTFSISAWGGNQFFIIPIGIFFIVLPFMRKDHKFLIWAVPTFSFTTLLVSLGFERGIIDASSFGGIFLLVTTSFLIICTLIQNFSSKNKTRNALLFLIAFLIVGSSIFVLNSSLDLLPKPSHRYLNAINPFLTTTDPLVDSVSEHATTTLAQSFMFNSVLIIFGGIGVWLLIKNLHNPNQNFISNDMLSFTLIFGLVGIYVSSTFLRLELFASISVIILSSLGISFLIQQFFGTNQKHKSDIKKPIKFIFAGGIIFLLTVPLVYPPNSNAIALTQSPPTILNGGTVSPMVTNDWHETLLWIKSNTNKNAVVASWWDYGYWIQTLGERATLADNSTLNTKIIQNIAKMLLSSPDDAWNSLNTMQADYVVIFVSASQLNLESTQLYTLGGGGDESKKQWFMRIGGFDETKFVYSDGLSGTNLFWEQTLLGKMIPYSILGYVHPNNLGQQSESYVPGFVGIYEKDVKLDSDDEPLKLVHASPGFYKDEPGHKLVVLVYEINKNYTPTK